jgi:RNA polymerase sigma-70 factor (ECF subfamily)
VSSSFPATRFTVLPLRREKDIAGPTYQETPAKSAEGPSDEALIARICVGDSEALGLLFRRYARLVWTIAYRILRNSEEADDLLQDLFLLVRRRASVFDSTKGTVRSLLVQMCYQRAFSRRRDLTRRHFYASAEVTENTATTRLSLDLPSYDESLEAHFGKIGLQRALRDLTEEQRDTLRLCFAEGYTLEEIAAQLGQSYGNVRHHYYRGLAKLRKHLKGNGL